MEDGEKREKVTWFPVIAFNGISEACANYLEKGRLVAVQGRVQTREYDDKEGTKHQVMQVVAEKVTFLGAAKREEHDDRRLSPGKPAASNRQEGTSAEDVPF